jgi:hypothetical protein
MDAHVENFFRNKDFYPDIDNLFNDMPLDGDNTNNNSSSAPTPHLLPFVLDHTSVLLAINRSRIDVG